jgi:hypothetical protein
MGERRTVMKHYVILRRLVLISAATFVVLGCSPGNGLNLAKVRGKVTYKGEPVKNGTVFFMPDESKGTVGPPAVGSITSDGSYIMSSSSSGDGVIVGSHKIGITGVEEKPVEGAADAPTPESDPQAYMKAKAKGAAAARSGRASKEVDTFTDRGGKKWRYVIPKKLTNPQESGIFAKVDRGSNTMNFEIDESGNVQITR